MAAACSLLGPVVLASHQTDSIELMLEHGPDAGEVTLRWTGGVAPFFVYRSTSPSALVDSANLVGRTTDPVWIDVGGAAAGAVFFYEVAGSGCAVGGGA